MAFAANKINDLKAKNTDFQNSREADVLDLKEYGEVLEARNKIRELVDNSEWRKFVSKETLSGYQKYLEKQKGLAPKQSSANDNSGVDSLESLLGLYEFMSSEWHAAKLRMDRLNHLLVALPKDYQNALVKKLILSGEYNLTDENALKFENIIKEKIDRFKGDNEKFEELSKHRFAKNLGILKLQKGAIKLNDKKSFQEATTLDRREFLIKIKESLRLEEVQEAMNEKNAEKLTQLYDDALKDRLADKNGKNGSIGTTTYEAYLEGFKELAEKKDFKGMHLWHKEFENQMKPRDKFWVEVRKTLQGPGLVAMESQIHEKGLKDLKAEFVKVKDEESGRLINSYSKALGKYQHIIGKHTTEAYEAWMGHQSLNSQYKAEKLLGREMDPYKKLRKEEEGLSEEHQEFIESKRDLWGYTERKKQIAIYKDEEKNENKNKAKEALAKIQNSAIKEAALGIRKNLASKGDEAEDKVIRIFDIKSKSKSKAPEFKEIEETIIKDEEKPEDKKSIGHEGRNEDPSLKENKVSEIGEFKKIETSDGQELKHVMADEKQGVDQLLSNFKGTTQDAELVSMSIYNSSREQVDLNKKDAAHIAEYLKEERKKRQEAA